MANENFRLPNNAAQQHDFARIPGGSIPRSLMTRNCGRKTTANFGEITPVFADEVVPGDTFTMRPTLAARLQTQLRPIMDSMFVDLHFFFVPYRTIWNNWERLCGAQDNPGDSTDFEVPIITAGSSVNALGVYDNFGVPPGVNHGEVTNLIARAYNKTWNEWYRDENLQDARVVDLDDGPDDPADYDTLAPRGKRHDYFTSALPAPQKGPAVQLPIGSQAPLVGTIVGDGTTPTFDAGSKTNLPLQTGAVTTGAGNAYQWYHDDPLTPANTDAIFNNPGLEFGAGSYADLTLATASTINELRNAIAVQRIYEKDMRAGTRYVEVLKAHYGTTLPDGRAQRAEFLGGSSARMTIQGVSQTLPLAAVPGAGTNVLGSQAGMAWAVDDPRGFTKTFVEHGCIIGLLSARADLTYQQGLPRMFSRRDRFDFYWPEFADIGEQTVLNKEIFAQGTSADDEVFGYQERYADYRYSPSLITGQMRSDHPNSYDIWHLAQDFASLPALGDTFIQDNPPIDRIVAVADEPDLLVDIFFEYKCARPMPMYGVPGLKRL